MNNLHEIIRLIASNPDILTNFIENPQIFIDMFQLSPSEVKALLDILNETVLQHLLSPNHLKNISEIFAEAAWIPTSGPMS